MKTEQLLLIKFHKIYNRLSKTEGSRGRILKILSNHNGISQRELQEIIDIKPGSLSEVLLKLEQTGLIRREHDEGDLRRQNVFITETGTAAFEGIRKNRELDSETVFEKLSREEKEQLLALLSKIIGDDEHYKRELKARKNC